MSGYAETAHAERVGGIDSGGRAVSPHVLDPYLEYGFARHVTATGAPLWLCEGRAGSAGDAIGPGGAANPTALAGYPGYSFDGGDSLTISGLGAGTAGTIYTHECWLTLNGADAYRCPMCLEHHIGQFWCILRTGLAVRTIQLYTNTGTCGNTQLALDTWHHVVASRNGNDHYFYVDGTFRGTVNCIPGAFFPPANYFGLRTGGQYWIGNVAMPAYYPGICYPADWANARYQSMRHIFSA